MIQKKFLTLTLLSLLTISGCSVLGTKKVEVVSKPIQLDIIQPTLPRELDLTPPQWYVVSEAVITNPCKKSLSFEPKRFTLGLDLQGGSYLLLEIDTEPILEQTFQSKIIEIKKKLRKNKIVYSDFKIKKGNLDFNYK